MRGTQVNCNATGREAVRHSGMPLGALALRVVRVRVRVRARVRVCVCGIGVEHASVGIAPGYRVCGGGPLGKLQWWWWWWWGRGGLSTHIGTSLRTPGSWPCAQSRGQSPHPRHPRYVGYGLHGAKQVTPKGGGGIATTRSSEGVLNRRGPVYKAPTIAPLSHAHRS